MKLKTINIKGKEYVQVVDRIKVFRELDSFKDWSIETQVNTDSGFDNAIAYCVIKDPEGRVRSTGTAWENRTNGHINKTSFVENAETSAVGRALGMLNVGLTDEICTADEILAKYSDRAVPDNASTSTGGGTNNKTSDNDVNKKLMELLGSHMEAANRWAKQKYGIDSILQVSPKVKSNIFQRPDDFIGQLPSSKELVK